MKIIYRALETLLNASKKLHWSPRITRVSGRMWVSNVDTSYILGIVESSHCKLESFSLKFSCLILSSPFKSQSTIIMFFGYTSSVLCYRVVLCSPTGPKLYGSDRRSKKMRLDHLRTLRSYCVTHFIPDLDYLTNTLGRSIGFSPAVLHRYVGSCLSSDVTTSLWVTQISKHIGATSTHWLRLK